MITLKGKTLSGKTLLLNNIISLDFEASLFVPCDSLKVKLPLKYEKEEFTELFGFIDGERFFSGYVDCQRLVKSKRGFFLTLESRSRASALLDNEALPYTYFGITTTELFNKFARPFGVASSSLPLSRRLNELQVEKGSSYWEVIENYCVALFKKRPRLTRDMELTIDQTNQKEHIIKSSGEGAPLKSAVTIRRDKQISKLYSKTGKTPYGNHYGVLLTNSIAKEKGIVRERYYHPGNAPRNIIAAESERIIHDSNKEGFSLELTLPYILDIKPGDKLRFEDNVVYSGLYVEELSYHIGADGIFTIVLSKDKRFL